MRVQASEDDHRKKWMNLLPPEGRREGDTITQNLIKRLIYFCVSR